MVKLFAVYQHGRKIASYYAKNEKGAINQHKADQMATAVTFKRSQPLNVNEFDDLSAVEIQPYKKA